MAKFLLVEDDAKLAAMVKEWLAAEGHIVEIADNGFAGLDLMRSFGYDVVVLDWELPGIAGPDICTKYRQGGGTAPVLMLTAKGAIEDKEKGFLSGVDDYLPKPFHPKELSLRLRALIARASGTVSQPEIKVGLLTLNRITATASVSDQVLKLTTREFALLEYLMRHQGQVFGTAQLLSNVWESEADSSDAGVRMCVSRLRDKLSAHPLSAQIETVTGFGYRLVCPSD